jgi:uncharacterized protein YqeY
MKERIEADLKAAMLGGDKVLTTTLRGLKAAILNVEVAQGLRDAGLADNEVIGLLQKEAKKRQESAELFGRGGNTVKQQEELVEKGVIEKYLPAQLGEDEITAIVDGVIAELGNEKQKMGQIMGAVKQKTGGSADGALVARLVSARLQ